MEWQVRPSVKKAVFLYLVKLGIAIAVLFFPFFIMNIFSGVGPAQLIADVLGKSISSPLIAGWMFGTIMFIGGVVVLMVVFNVRSVRYVFTDTKLVSYRNPFNIQLNQTEIPYHNITSLTYKKNLFGIGTIKLMLTGMDTGSFDVDFIENPKEMAERIQTLLARSNAAEAQALTFQQRTERSLGAFA